MKTKGISWGWIIFWIIFFWPIGLYLVFKKFEIDKSAIMSGKIGTLSFMGWVLLVFGVMSFLINVVQKSEKAEALPLIFAVGGILLLCKASKAKKIAIKYRKYIEIVVNQNIKSIEKIASAVGLSYNVVAKDLQNMIYMGYLKDAYIHQGNREIILKQHEHVPVMYDQNTSDEQFAPQTKATRCPCCGANNVIAVGKVTECEYCRTPINT